MTYKIKEIKNANYKLLLKIAIIFNIEKIDISYYENFLLRLYNYCITPSMKGRDKLFIRNLFYCDFIYLDDIIKTLCNYCKNINLIIMTTFDNNIFTQDCKDALFNNNFKGNDVIYYLY